MNKAALQIESDLALERKNIYWRRYKAQMERHGFDADETRLARKLYGNALCRYYSISAELHQGEYQ